MKREYSLKGRKQFRNVFRRGKRLKGNFVQILVLKTGKKSGNGKEQQKPEIKIGISVPKRFGKAHRRNWAKRRIRSILSDLTPFITDNYLIIVKPELLFRDQKFSAIQEEITELLSGAGILQI